MEEIRAKEIVAKVQDILAPVGLELHPFKVYNYISTSLLNNTFLELKRLVK